jgi:radical SAM protein with 4Fe4S-binding SPASM domain
VPYLKAVKTLSVRRTSIGTYLCVPYSYMLETFFPTLEIDESVESVLALCDGTKTREDILNLLSKESGEPIEAFADDLDELVEYFVGEGVLEWNDEPSFLEPLYNKNKPLSIFMEITSACNLRCPMCSTDSGEEHPDDVTLDDIIPFVEQMKKYKPTPFTINGGEPLRKKDILLYMVEELSPVKEIIMSVFTNGTLITRDYAQQLYDAGLRIARVSVDGHTAEVHDAIRGNKTFEKTIEGIQYLRELGVHVEIATVISRMNYEYLQEIRTFVGEIGDSYNIGAVRPTGRAAHSDLVLNPDETFKVRMGDVTLDNLSTNITPLNRCNVGEAIFIRPSGDIFPCFMLPFPEFKVGNIKENDLADIYTTDLMQNLLNLTVKDLTPCRECDIRYYCGGACRGSAYAAGSLYSLDPDNCEKNKVLVRTILQSGEENTRNILQDLLKSTRERG